MWKSLDNRPFSLCKTETLYPLNINRFALEPRLCFVSNTFCLFFNFQLIRTLRSFLYDLAFVITKQRRDVIIGKSICHHSGKETEHCWWHSRGPPCTLPDDNSLLSLLPRPPHLYGIRPVAKFIADIYLSKTSQFSFARFCTWYECHTIYVLL